MDTYVSWIQTLQLLVRLIRRDLAVRYKVAFLGFFWSLLKPLALWLVFFTVFSLLMGNTRQLLVDYQDAVPYGIWLLAGMFAWMFFAQAVQDAAGSILGHAHLVCKVAMPRWTLPASAVGANLVNFFFSFVVLETILALWGITPTWKILWLPGVVLIQTILALALGLLTAVLMSMFRDIAMMLDLIVTTWFYFTPVFYPLALVKNYAGGKYLWLYLANPMSAVIYSYQRIIFDCQASSTATLAGWEWALALGWSALMAGGLLGVAAIVYRRYDPTLVDYL